MNRRSSLLVVGFLVAALIGVALLAVPGSPLRQEPTLGLDLQGGLEVTLQAVPPPDRDLTDEDLDRSVEIMRSRVDRLGVTEPEIRTQGDDQIVIQLPGVSDPEAAADIIGKTAQLELYDLETSLTGPSVSIRGEPVEFASLYDLLARVQAQAAQGTPTAYYVFNKNTKRLVDGPFDEKEAADKVAAKRPRVREVLAVPEAMVVVTCGENAVVCPGAQGAGVVPDRTYYYLFKYEPPEIPQMTGEDLKLDGTRADFDTSPGGGGRAIVTMEFTGRGSDKFEEITRNEWTRGRIRQAPQHFAIVLDREIRTFPQIDYTDSSLSGGIGGGRAQIEGLEDLGEANDIAIVLQTGALPVNFETLTRTDISATLGKDSLEEAKRAAIGGLILVAFFLLLFYRFLGVVAVIGLGIYAGFLYATILLFDVTLTLPGFAGLVLTFGVAADANIVIFERIKEEVRGGRSMRAAIAQGYKKGFATIVDANVVTAITALVLFAVATASVRGFALMLLIGTALSMLTAVLATRAILALLSGFGWIDNPRLMGATGQGVPRWLRIDYIGLRRIWFAFSGIVVAISLGAILFMGLNLGIDFEGGTQINFRTPQPTSLETVREQAAAIGQADAVIQGRGSAVDDQYHELPDPDRLAHDRGAERASGRPRPVGRRDGVRRDERLRELRSPDSELGDLRDHRQPAPDRRLRDGALPVEVLGRRPRRPRARRADHGRRVRADREGGVDRDRGRGAHRPRLLDLRHDHHLRPHPRERALDATSVLPGDRQRLAVGGAAALAGDDVHHARADRRAVRLRRRHAQGLRVRPPRRHRIRRVLLDLPRGPARGPAQGAGAGVREAARRPRSARGSRDRQRDARDGGGRRGCGRLRGSPRGRGPGGRAAARRAGPGCCCGLAVGRRVEA